MAHHFVTLTLADGGQQALVNLEAVGYIVEPPSGTETKAKAGVSFVENPDEIIPVMEDLDEIRHLILGYLD